MASLISGLGGTRVLGDLTIADWQGRLRLNARTAIGPPGITGEPMMFPEFVKALVIMYGPWGEHSKYSIPHWREWVSNGDTRLGYWDWVAAQIKWDMAQVDSESVTEPREPTSMRKMLAEIKRSDPELYINADYDSWSMLENLIRPGPGSEGAIRRPNTREMPSFSIPDLLADMRRRRMG